MSNTYIYIGEYFKIEFILLLLDMLCQHFGETLIYAEKTYSMHEHILENAYFLTNLH